MRLISIPTWEGGEPHRVWFECSKPTYRIAGSSIGDARCRDSSAISPSVVFTHPFGSLLGICKHCSQIRDIFLLFAVRFSGRNRSKTLNRFRKPQAPYPITDSASYTCRRSLKKMMGTNGSVSNIN